jgi:hypothetical protein
MRQNTAGEPSGTFVSILTARFSIAPNPVAPQLRHFTAAVPACAFVKVAVAVVPVTAVQVTVSMFAPASTVDTTPTAIWLMFPGVTVTVPGLKTVVPRVVPAG